jgi:hypothetical protein
MKKTLLFLIMCMACLGLAAQQPQWEVLSPSGLDGAHPQLTRGDQLGLRFSIRDDMGNSIAFNASAIAVRLLQAGEEPTLIARIPVVTESNQVALTLGMADLDNHCMAATNHALPAGAKIELTLHEFACPALSRATSTIAAHPNAKFTFVVQ